MEPVRGHSLSVGVLLSSCSSRIEEIVDTLKSSAALARSLVVFVHRVLKLDVGESSKDLISINALAERRIN